LRACILRAFGLCLVALLATAVGCQTAVCKPDTILLTIVFDDTTRFADQLYIDVSIGAGAPKRTILHHEAADAEGTVEIDFPNGSGYPYGQPVKLTVTALRAGAVLNAVTVEAPGLPAGCVTASIAVMSTLTP
jgi:hypothetical protein